MRPNVARKRCSYAASRVEWAQRPYFVLRLDPVIGRRLQQTGICAVVYHTVGAGAVAAVISLLPLQRPIVMYVYLPVLGLTAARWIGDLLQIPLGMLLLAAGGVCFCCAASVPNFNPLAQVMFGLSAMAFVLPFVARFLVAMRVPASRRATLWLVTLFGAAGLLWLTERAPRLWQLLSIGQCGLLGLWCLLLVRAYVSRLAAAPETPTVGAYALVDLSRSLWDVPRGRRVPGLPWWGCAAATVSAAWGAWLLLALRDHAGIEDGARAWALWALATIGALGVASQVRGISLWAHAVDVTRRFTVTLLLWWGDPALQFAADSRVRSQWGVVGMRWGLTLSQVVLLSLGMIALASAEGLADWRQFWRERPWSECLYRALLVAGEAAVRTTLAAWLLCGPWLGYVDARLKSITVPEGDER